MRFGRKGAEGERYGERESGWGARGSRNEMDCGRSYSSVRKYLDKDAFDDDVCQIIEWGCIDSEDVFFNLRH